MTFGDLLLGRRLRSEEQDAQQIGPIAGIPVLGLDALASAAYGPEAALTILLPLGAAAVSYIAPITAIIVGLLLIVFTSYRQTIAAYPNGGGSYAVAAENLGSTAGLVAAAALAVDYILNVAVAISAGVGAIVSAVPRLLPATLPLTLGILVFLTLVNLRGVREAGLLFMIPTYLFVICLAAVVIVGALHVLGANTRVASAAPAEPTVVHGVTAWLLVRAFASGCTAMTGIEAVSNGVPLFREPRVVNARRTLASIIIILAALLLGIALLASAYRIGATVPGAPGYESLLSLVVRAIAGRGAFYYLTMAAVLSVLCLSANTSFAGFPRLCRLLALDEYLPSEFAHQGRRLVYSRGVVVLALLAGVLLFAFRGITDRLIPLFAVGAFLAFTMSQSGMVAHWRRVGGEHATRGRTINLIGAMATGLTVLVVIVSKFREGAWITALAIPAFVALFRGIRRFHDRVDAQTEDVGAVDLGSPHDRLEPPIVVVPIKRFDRLAHQALRLAVTLSPDVQVLQVRAGEPNTHDLRDQWESLVDAPAHRAGVRPPSLVLVPSTFREVISPLVDYVRRLARANQGRYVAVVIPELVERRWYHLLLHSHRATLLKALLLLRGGSQVIVINTPWYVRDRDSR